MKTEFNAPSLMGILNLTEDSFSDGALYLDTGQACLHAEELINEGAQIIDLGAESTRPGSLPVAEDLELQRILPVLKYLKQTHPQVMCSIDTQKAVVAAEAIALGAEIINDISALRYDKDMAGVIASNPQVKLILMHMQGTPRDMQLNPHYHDVLAEIKDFFSHRIEHCQACGIKRSNLMIDPGIGFGKNLADNLKIMVNLAYFADFQLPLVLGASRKSFINMISPTPVNDRLEGSLAAAALGLMQGVAILRVHDVKAHKRFIDVFCALQQAGAE